jgi:hypothetical protein
MDSHEKSEQTEMKAFKKSFLDTFMIKHVLNKSNDFYSGSTLDLSFLQEN